MFPSSHSEVPGDERPEPGAADAPAPSPAGEGGRSPAAEPQGGAGREFRDGEERILRAAQELIAQGGVDALSMRAVASRVGVSATAIYHYFEGKQDLVSRVVGRAFRHFKAYLEEAAGSHPPGSWDRIHALGDAYIRFAEEKEQYFRVLFAIQPEHRNEIEELPGKGGYELLKEAVVAATEGGEIRDGDVEEIVLYLWAIAHGLVTLSLACKLRLPPTGEGEPISAAELFRRIREYVPDGLRPRRGTSSSAPATGRGDAAGTESGEPEGEVESDT